MLKEIKIELTNKCARNCKHCSSNATRTDETLNKYKHLINLGLNKIVYSLADSLSDEKDISIYNNEDIIRYMYEHQDEESR